jgi:2-polyprenyl-6-methoxyphenol hydroxylase-like FAD-dependent oxidoreductase
MLWSNALNALAQLDLADAVVRAGVPIDCTEFRSWSGRLLAWLPVGEMGRRAGAPSILISRDALLAILAGHVGADALALDHPCTGFAQGPDGVEISFTGGRRIQASMLVGADGLGSVVRAQLRGDEAPRDTEMWAGGGTATLDRDVLPRGVCCSTIGRGARFCIAACGEGEVFWVATVNQRRKGRPLDMDDRDDLRRCFGDCHAPVPEIIAATPEETMFGTRVRDRAPMSSWGRGRITLLGDAAHPCTPDLGQGACQAIESAVVLGRALAARNDPEAGLRRYEDARREHAALVTNLSWIATTQSMRDDPVFCLARDLLTDVFLTRIATREIWKLMSHRV